MEAWLISLLQHCEGLPLCVRLIWSSSISENSSLPFCFLMRRVRGCQYKLSHVRLRIEQMTMRQPDTRYAIMLKLVCHWWRNSDPMVYLSYMKFIYFNFFWLSIQGYCVGKLYHQERFRVVSIKVRILQLWVTQSYSQVHGGGPVWTRYSSTRQTSLFVFRLICNFLYAL